ncbi:alpha/beta hydrolase [Aquiflexum sp. LQ15W]|uniref:alpha/beta hydrolase n=1 Tax=Cognataquiflexum nitidum TaxID=2922272 RepID=UPI001F12C295|nr:alpha/beta hydrolase [Cognataquiflexum nitidum]MCH6198219.1 alpha/beta hydrolase [Cognataquiflexum nitidum]
MKKTLQFFLGFAILLAIIYILGPKSKVENLSGEYPSVPTRMGELQAFIQAKSDTVLGLKTGNEAKIVWADSVNKSKTPYSIIYIHGFGASNMEGDPVHRELADYFGANLYLVRLPEHGISRPDGFRHLTAQKLVDEVREAYMVGKSLGDSVIIVGTSMGGALSLVLASERPDMKALVLYSPCVKEYGDSLEIFFKPWWSFLAEKFQYENGTIINNREGEKAKYWSREYHLNSYRSLGILIRSKMNAETFKEIHQPLFLGYYYKNEEEQDKVVSVPKMLEMYDQIQTSEDKKVKVAFPESGDHVIASSITSKDWEGVLRETKKFLEEVAGIPVPAKDLILE